MENNNSKSFADTMGDYVRGVLDLNKDGKVTVKEWLEAVASGNAILIIFLVVDALSLIAEYRVWHVGMMLTGDPLAAAGFVAVSAVPFYAAQVMWIYPRINGIQQFIAVIVGLAGLTTSAVFGMADLSRQYDMVAISKLVNWAWWGYMIAFIMFLMADNGIRLKRANAHVRASAAHRSEVNKTTRGLLSDLRDSLLEEKALREEFGDDAVEAHIRMLSRQKEDKKVRSNHRLPEPANGKEPPTNP